MQTVGPFYKFAPGDTINLAVGIVLGKGIEGLRRNADYLAEHYPEFATIPVSVKKELSNAPHTFKLKQNYPNPFNPFTTIAYELPKAADVELTIYNLLGQRIRTLVQKHHSSGRFFVRWDGKDKWGKPVASGVYVYKLEAKTFTGEKIVDVKKMVLIR